METKIIFAPQFVASARSASLLRICSISLVVLAVSGLQSAPGADIVWDGDGNGQNGKNWNNANAWVGDVLPNSTDNAIFNNLVYNSPAYQPTITSSTGNTAASVTITGLHFNNATAQTILTVPDASSLAVSNTTLVSQNATVTLAGTGAFTTNNLSILASRALTIPSVTIAGRLSGAGSVAGNVVVSGIHSVGGSSTLAGVYTPGSGTQAVTGSLTYNSGSIFSWDLAAGPTDPGVNTANSGNYDKVTALSLTGTSSVFNIVLDGSFSDAFWNTNKSWSNVFSGATNLATVFTSFSGNGVSSGGITSKGTFSFSGSTLNFTAVPEPTSALAGILLGAGLLRRRRGSFVQV